METKKLGKVKVTDIAIRVAAGVGVGFICYKIGKHVGMKMAVDNEFGEGFYKATELIHDAIVDVTDTVKLNGTGNIVDLQGYLNATADNICDHLGDLADNEALALIFESGK